MPQSQGNRPEGKTKKTPKAPKTRKGKVHNRGHNPSRTYFTNHTAGACVDRSSHDPKRWGFDAGWGVAKKEPRFAVFRREYTTVDGVSKIRVLAVLRGDVVPRRMQAAFGVDEIGEKPMAAVAKPSGEATK